jgi:hypothetical protein
MLESYWRPTQNPDISFTHANSAHPREPYTCRGGSHATSRMGIQVSEVASGRRDCDLTWELIQQSGGVQILASHHPPAMPQRRTSGALPAVGLIQAPLVEGWLVRTLCSPSNVAEHLIMAS